jgi:phosphoglycerate kinase
MTTIDNYNFSEKKVLLRVDFNIPTTGDWGEYDLSRIKSSLPTIHKVLTEGASIIFLSHWGRPLGKYEERRSFKHIVPILEKILDKKIIFCENPISDETLTKSKNLSTGDVMLLENLRFFKGEQENDAIFAEQLAALGDCYINDAFGAAHRVHASTVGIAKFFPYV